MLRKRGMRWALAAGIVALVLIGLGVAAFQPRVANAFGYALPGPRGLPFRIHYGGRDFGNQGMCAGADWCRNGPPTAGNCMSSAAVQHLRWWPLDRVGTMYTLFGPAYPIMSIRDDNPRMLLFVQLNADCYIVYTLEGGP